MKLLVIDFEEETRININFLEKKETTWQFFFYDNDNEALDFYISNDVDFIIIDFSIKEFDELLEKIMEINPLQKTITISKKISQSELEGCLHCQNTKKRKRLMKPLNIVDLYELIKNFDTQTCKYFNNFDNIKLILTDILKQFVFFEYNEEQRKICHVKKFKSNTDYDELLDITRILNEHNINYEVNAKNEIIIL